MRPAMPDETARLIAALARPAGESSDFDLNPAVELPPGRVLRPAAVLIALWQSGGETRLILTKRASHLQHHPGQIAFPGGKLEQDDSGPEAAALREAEEEIGLQRDNVTVLGCLPAHETVTGFSVIPVLGRVREGFAFRPDPSEVEEVFSVPLPHVLEVDRYSIEKRLWRGAWRRYYAVPYGPYYIWGATARILRGMAERMRE
jgi:8-oxo-dGTP pyrophosphatase MutT (NUDIX family)